MIIFAVVLSKQEWAVKKVFNSANCFSALRIVLTPCVVWLLVQSRTSTTIVAIIIFSIAAMTDTLDGYLARRLKLETTLGSYLDPIADKVLITATFFSFWMLTLVPWWFLVLLVGRDVVITLLRSMMISCNQKMRTSFFGKVKTVTQFVALYFLFGYVLVSRMNLLLLQYYCNVLASWSIVIVAWLTVVTGIDYLIRNRHFLLFLCRGCRDT